MITKNKLFIIASLLLFSLLFIKALSASSALMTLIFLLFFSISFAVSPKLSYLLYIPFSLFFEQNYSTEIARYVFSPLSSNMMLFKNWTDIFHSEIYKFSSFDIILLTYILYFVICVYFLKKETRIPHFNLFIFGYLSYLILFALWGFIHKSDPFAAYWQVKPLAYLPFIYVLTYYFIDNIGDIYLILSGIFTATMLKLFQTYYFANIIAPGLTVHLRSLSLSHEETLFYIFIILLLFFIGRFFQHRIAPVICSVMIIFSLVGLTYARRRIAFPLLALSLFVLFIFYRGANKRQIQISLGVLLVALISLFFILTYSPNTIPFSETAKSVATGIGWYADRDNQADFTSNYYRMIEQTNLQYNIKYNFLGTGLGAQLKEIHEQIHHFIGDKIFSHNQILQLWALTGIFGFILFLSFWAWLISYFSFLHLNSKDTFLSVLTICVVCYFVMYLLFSYYDMALMEYRQNILLGLLIGSVIKLKELTNS